MVHDAGLYWYHPHVMSAAQVGFGLYGALLVEDPADGVGVDDQLTIVLSDIGFDAKGVLEPADSGGSAGMVFGREGDYVLVNGRRNPGAGARPARRSAGASSTPRRAGSSSWISTDRTFTVIGTDGGLQEHRSRRECCSSRPASAWT